MELSGARVLVAGATGALGGAITAELADRGARVALAGRDRGRLAHTARAYPSAPTAGFDAYDPGSCARAVHEAAAALKDWTSSSRSGRWPSVRPRRSVTRSRST